jgi:hypothetical protein
MSTAKAIDAERVKGFYDLKENTLDIAVVGASTLRSGWDSMDVWDKYGITSYAYTTNAQPPTLRNFICNDINRNQDPKVYIFDYSGYTVNSLKPTDNKLGKIRLVADVMPFGMNRVEAIDYSLNSMNYKGDRFKFYYGFYEYHNAYKGNAASEPMPEGVFVNGMFINSSIFRVKEAVQNPAYQESAKTAKIPAACEKVLLDTIDYIKTTKLPCLFVLYPRVFQEGQREKHNMVEEILEENGIPYLDLTKKFGEIGVDLNTDFKDDGVHQNYYGATKTTDYLIKYLKEEYGLESHKEEAGYEQFASEYERYENALRQYSQSAP